MDSQSVIVQMNLKTESTLAQKSALQSQGGQMVVLWFEPHLLSEIMQKKQLRSLKGMP